MKEKPYIRYHFKSQVSELVAEQLYKELENLWSMIEF
jgi:hypothetical protein